MPQSILTLPNLSPPLSPSSSIEMSDLAPPSLRVEATKPENDDSDDDDWVNGVEQPIEQATEQATTDMDLTQLWDPHFGVERDHPPPPEAIYPDLKTATEAVTKWGFDHGVSYRRHKWTDNRRVCGVMVCSRHGKPRQKQQGKPRPGAASGRIDCRMQFFMKAYDKNCLATSQWVVQHALDQKSLKHNHPPEKDPSTYPKYRRGTRTDEMRQQLEQIWYEVRGPKQALILLQGRYPESKWTRQDVRNEFRKMAEARLGEKTKTEALLEHLQLGGYFFR
jgi:hypothetical protein